MAGSSLRILHCLRAPVGGLFRHVCDLAEAQAALGHDVGIVADASTGGAAAQARLQALEATCALGVVRFAMARMPGPGDVSVAIRVAKTAKALRPDVLHGHGAKGGAYARLAGTWLRRGADRPVRAYTPHGGTLHYSPTSPTGLVFLTLERLLSRRTDVFLFESDYGRQMFAEKVGDTGGIVRVVHNGLRPAEFEPVVPAPDAADFVFVGELRHLKGIDTLLAALASLNRSGGATAVIVGAGDEGAQLQRTAADLGLGDRVTFAGAMPARQAFARARCVVVPSRAESLPYIVLEAAAARLPIVATRVGGIAEIFGDQADRLVPPDDPQRLAAAMDRIRRDPAAARVDADKLSAYVERRFSLEGMAKGVLDAYISTLSSPALKAS
jgi:glycosyltransferase involved in cell wall biosynthesis